MDRNELETISCLKCLTSLGYNANSTTNMRDSPTNPTCEGCTTVPAPAYRVYDNLIYINGMHYEKRETIGKKNKRGKTIKLQDCTTWLALTNKDSYENQYGHLNRSKNQQANSKGDLASSLHTNQLVMNNNQNLTSSVEHHQSNQMQANFFMNQSINAGTEKINMLLNRKSGRAMT